MNVIRILIADDHFVVRVGLRTLIGTYPDLSVVGEAGSAEEAVSAYAALRPDVVVLDLRMPDGGGLHALKAMREADPEAKVILFTSFGSEEEVFQAMQAGACGYIHKNESSEDVLAAIRAVHAGGRWIPERVESLQKDRVARPVLTTREVEVLELIFEGHSNKQIAYRLGVAENTIKNHINNLMAKLNARDRTHAANLALKRGLIQLEPETI